MFSEKINNSELDVVISGCKDCLFKAYNKDMKKECFFTKEVVEHERWGTTVPKNCPIGLSFKSKDDKIISFIRHSYTDIRD